MKNFVKISLLVLFLLCFSPDMAKAKLFGAQNFHLPNGLEVVVIENHKAPIIKCMLWYKAGAVDEAEGKGGSAHLLEHLMFRGTKKVSGEEFDRLLKQNGVESNAFTSLDFTAYHHNADISKLELVLALEADRMENLQISDKNFALERDIVYQERKQMVDNNPSATFFEAYRNLLWQEHPYHRPVSGTSAEIKALTKSDIENFYHKYYQPNNAVLVLSGDIDLQTAKLLAEKYFGKIENKTKVEKTSFPSLANNRQAELKMSLPQITSERLVKTYVAPSYNTDKTAIYALSIFSKYLGDGETSELYKDLVLDKKLALSVSSAYDYTARSYGLFQISALPAEGVSAQELSQAVNEAVSKAVQNMSLDKINNTKDKMLSGLVYLLDNPFDAAETVGAMTAAGMSIKDIENLAQNIKSVTYQEVKTAAQNLFSQSGEVKGILSPQGAN